MPENKNKQQNRHDIRPSSPTAICSYNAIFDFDSELRNGTPGIPVTLGNVYVNFGFSKPFPV